MYYEYYDTKLGALLSFTNDIRNHKNNFSIRSVIINITENRNEVPVCLFIAGLEMELLLGQLLTTTYLQQVTYRSNEAPLTAFLPIGRFY